MATQTPLSEREKTQRRLKMQRRKISKTIKLFARQLDKFLGELAEVATTPPLRLRTRALQKDFPRPMSVVQAELGETRTELLAKTLEAHKKLGKSAT